MGGRVLMCLYKAQEDVKHLLDKIQQTSTISTSSKARIENGPPINRNNHLKNGLQIYMKRKVLWRMCSESSLRLYVLVPRYQNN